MTRKFTKYPNGYVKGSREYDRLADGDELFIYGIKWDISEKAFIDKALKMPSRTVSRLLGSSFGRKNEEGKIEFLMDAYTDLDYLIPELFGLPDELELPAYISADFTAIDNYLMQTYGFRGYGYTIITLDSDGDEIHVPYQYS